MVEGEVGEEKMVEFDLLFCAGGGDLESRLNRLPRIWARGPLRLAIDMVVGESLPFRG